MIKNNRWALLLAPFFLLACFFSSPAPSPTPAPAATPTQPATQRAGKGPETPTPACGVVIALESLNLRREPSEDSQADPAGLRNGDTVEVLSQGAGWWFVQTSDGRRGWVRAKYMVSCMVK